MCNKSKERLKGRKEKNDIHVRNISSDEKYRWKGDANDRALQMTERDRDDVPGRKKGRRTPDVDSFRNFAWACPLISTRQIRRA